MKKAILATIVVCSALLSRPAYGCTWHWDVNGFTDRATAVAYLEDRESNGLRTIYIETKEPAAPYVGMAYQCTDFIHTVPDFYYKIDSQSVVRTWWLAFRTQTTRHTGYQTIDQTVTGWSVAFYFAIP